MPSTETLTEKYPVFVLRGADTSIAVAISLFAYAGVFFLHQSKFTMHRPITMNI